MASKKKLIKEALTNCLGQRFRAHFRWYEILAVSYDGQYAFVRCAEHGKERIAAKSAYDYLQITVDGDRNA